MSTLPVNGTTLYYVEHGQGPACLVMHGGLGLDHTSYRGLDMLGDRLRLVYYDHRCNGRSGRPALDTLTMEQLADDAAELAARVCAGPVLVIGHSYGGFVAQEFALRHPGKVSGLVLVDTTAGQPGRTESPEEYQGPPPPAELSAALASTPATDEQFADGMRLLLPYYLHRTNPADIADVFAETRFNAAAMSASMRVLAGWSSADRLAGLRVPALVLVGSHDPVASVPQAHRIARGIPGARLVEFEHSGHLPWLEEPERFADVLRAWLDSAVPALAG